MKTWRWIVSLTAALPLWACAAGDSGGGWAGTVRDSAGVQIVENPATGIWGTRPRVTLTEDLRIGAADGDPEYQFGQIAGLGITSAGEILVLDGQAAHLKVFSPSGEHVRTIGRPGSGPGEFGAGAAGVLVVQGDTVLVPDMGNQRVNRFLPNGEALGSFRIAFETGIPIQWNVLAGRAVLQLRKFPLPNQPVPDTMDQVVMIATDGSVLDTIRSVPAGKTFSMTGDMPEFNFFSAEPAWSITERGSLLYAINSDYRISVYGPDGALQRIITKPFEREPVSESDRSAMTSAIERLWREAGLPPQAVEFLKSRIHFAETYPAFLQFMGGPDGSIWVQRIARPSTMSSEEREAFNPMLDLGSNVWDVFDAEGRYLGPVAFPVRFQPMKFADDLVYGIWRDELDVQYVMRLRIEMPQDQS